MVRKSPQGIGRVAQRQRVAATTTAKRVHATTTSSQREDASLTRTQITDCAIGRVHRLERIHHHRLTSRNDTAQYWMLIAITILANFFISFVLVFFVVFLTDLWLSVILVILGIAFGLVYATLLQNMRLLTHHHVYAKTLFFVTSTIQTAFVAISALSIREYMGLETNHMLVVILSATYYCSFFIPYAVHRISKVL